MKNDITYEYRKTVKRPDLIVGNIELGECTYKVLKDELKKPSRTSRLYHTTDTNQFFYDFKGKRYELSWLGSAIDDSGLTKELASIKKDIEELKKNPAGLTDEDKELLENVKTLLNGLNIDELATEKWVENKGYLTDQDISGKQDKLTDSQLANLNADHSKYLTEHQPLDGYATEKWVENKGYLTDQDISGKQDKLTAGANITIENNVISANVTSKNENIITIYSNVENPFRTIPRDIEVSEITINETTDDGATFTNGEYYDGFDNNKKVTGKIISTKLIGKELVGYGVVLSVTIPSEYSAAIFCYEPINKIWSPYEFKVITYEYDDKKTYIRTESTSVTQAAIGGTYDEPIELRVIIYK
jgi:hypothetical protein